MLLALLAISVVLVFTVATANDRTPDLEPEPGESRYIEHAERLLAAALETGDELGTAQAQYFLAQHMKALRLFPQALTHARLAQETALLAGDETIQLAANIAYAASLGQLARSAEAIGILLPALEQARRLDNVEQQLWALLALGTAYLHAGDLQQAQDYGQQGLELARAVNNRTQTASFLSNLGLLAYTRGDLALAEALVREALTLEDLPPDIQRTLTSASITLAGKEEAETWVREAISNAQRDGNIFHEGFATAQLGNILCEQGEFDEANQAFEAADALLREADSLTDLQRMLEIWARCLEQTGALEQALAQQREAKVLLERVHERRQDEMRLAHETAFQTEQRLAELARLTAEEQALQVRVARQRALSGWLAAGALLLLGILAGFWVRNRNLRARHRSELALQQARVDLLARTSHEIRNPTQGMIGILEGGLESDAPLQRKSLGAVLSAARMVGHLANEYLDLALLEQGKFHIDTDALCHLPGLFGRLEALSAAFIKAPDQYLVTHIDESLPEWVHADGERLAQVLLNLISNAAHYAGDGEITLTLGTDSKADELRFSVADCGPGFSELDMSGFDPYSRGSQHRSNPRGSGLGLAISARIIRAMGGTLTARNRSTGGADLVLTFPLRAVSPDADSGALKAAPDYVRKGADTQAVSTLPESRRVLIIDDDPFARLGLRCLVESIGGQARELESGQNVEQLVQDFDPHAVLVDYRLGNTTGIDIARLIRHQDSGRAVPRLIAIISGSGSLAEEEDSQSVVDQWLLKPVGRKALIELLS